MKFLKSSFLSAILLLMAVFLGSCVREEMPDNREKDYGYVQFRLYKNPTKGTIVPQLDYLNEVKKVGVYMEYDGKSIYQTLTLEASSDLAAEFGLRSQKLQLAPGHYTVTSFVLFDAWDEQHYLGGASDSFDIVAGGLQVHDLFAKTQSRGFVKFTLVKDFSATKAAVREYTFDEIKYADVTVKNLDDDNKTSFEGLKASFDIHFDGKPETDGYQISSAVCDTLLHLEAGNYVIYSYNVYDEDKDLLERNTNPSSDTFTIVDNELSEANVNVKMEKAAAYLRDYQALKKIWLALDGPHWYYQGETLTPGCNWDFNKDMDLWGDQPGVSLHSNGRVAVLNLSDFGFRGELPAAIGDLTELVELYLGTHNDFNTTDFDPTVTPGQHSMDRMTAHKQYYKRMHPAVPFSEPIARALMEHQIVIPETEMYLTLSEDKVLDKQGMPVIKPMDMIHGKLLNGLTSIDPAIGKLTKLEKIFIANGKLKSLPSTMKNMTGLTDIEIYNCPEMTEFPMVLAEMPALVAVNIANNRQWSSEEIEKGFRAICNGAAKKEIQIWYMAGNNMTIFPSQDIKNLEKISLLDLSNNKISVIDGPMGTSVKFVNLGLSNNNITDESWQNFGPDDLFFGYDDLEGLTFAHNKMETLPNIFTTDLAMAIKSVDFSFNDIKSVPEDFRGINVETLILANNPHFGKLTDVFAESGSIISMINLRGCGITEIEKGFFEGKHTIDLMSMDLSYNHLNKLPKTMHAGNTPYLYGVDISYNRFSEFPYIPLDASGLTVFAIRGQRDANGNRCLKTWPDGIEQHVGLRGLYLGSNDIRKVTSPISPLCYMLDISDNPNIVFDATDICAPIQAGAYVLIYDKTQDIRNCPVLLN